MNIDTQLQTIIENLEDGVKVSYEALNDPDQGYPYATGYSRSTMPLYRRSSIRYQSVSYYYSGGRPNDHNSNCYCQI